MSLFEKPVSTTDDYLIRMDAMTMALSYQAGSSPKNKREFLQVVDAFFGYLKAGEIPEILSQATKTVLKGK